MEDPYDPTREFVGPLPEPDGADQSTVESAYSDDVDETDVRSDEEVQDRIDALASYFADEDIEDMDVLEARIVDHLAAGQGIDPAEYGGAEFLAEQLRGRIN